MLAIAFAGRNAQNKMQPVCQEALEALTQRDAERWQSCLHPTKAADELRDMDAFLSELGFPLRGDWQLERMTGHETEISDKDHYTTAEFRASADGGPTGSRSPTCAAMKGPASWTSQFARTEIPLKNESAQCTGT